MITEYKAFNVRVPKDYWTFLRYMSIEQDKSMNAIVLECIAKFVKRNEKKFDNMINYGIIDQTRLPKDKF